MYSFSKTFKMCSGDQERCSFYVIESGTYHVGHLNNEFVLWKYTSNVVWLTI